MSSRDRRAIIIGGVLVAIAVVYRFALSPVFDQWADARATAEAQTALIAEFEEKIEKRKAIRDRLEKKFGPGVHGALPTADEAQVSFPRSVQQSVGRGGAGAKQVEVQGFRRMRDFPGIELFSLRVQVSCEPDAIPKMLMELGRAELPVVIDSISLNMSQRGQRNEWQATLVVSTPILEREKKS